MTRVDGKEQDGFMVADEPELGSGKSGGKGELGSRLNRLLSLAEEMELGQGAGVSGLVVFHRPKVEVVTTLANALGSVGPEGRKLSVEISYRVECSSASFETHIC